ncbi:MAG TPA: hypothetical protein VFR43_14045 [Gaiellaceae bacterium]|nr:hypothetical protein [Gaiellaceae bacterium]
MLAGLAALLFAGPAAAENVLLGDGQGRTIRFDVRTGSVDPGWYAGVLRRVAHGDEIEHVTIRIVDWDGLRERCGPAAAGCYKRRSGEGVLVVPVGSTRGIAHTLVHEYGHHVDAFSRHGGLEEPNGTRNWWRVRGLARLVELNSVARTYEKGWSRSIAEIFAEDYAYLNVGRPYNIPWLKPPGPVVEQAILADLGLAPPPDDVPGAPAIRPLVIERSGILAAGDGDTASFGLLGTGRTVVASASLPGPARSGSRARLTVTCGATTRSRTIGPALRSETIRLSSVGPGQCRATLLNTGSIGERYRLAVHVSIRA